jgi:eukaryotic-like serine/threonine-protein kinase
MSQPESAAAHQDDLSGRSLGGYRLLRRLGSGAMGNVYLAEQQSLGRQVAVKVLRGDASRHPGAVERFSQEARAAAALVHGNIVQIHEVACVDGVHFLAEEYVAGPSLRAWLLARGPLDAPQALSVLSQVGSALVKSAQAGIVHRDIKPENLLVTPAGEVKVADFGLARVLEDDLELTQQGMTLGTPLYMSPEQAAGRPVDVRSDLYSLGASVYHLLAGRPPFIGTTSLAVALAHQREQPMPLAAFRPELPAGLGRIVEQLLAKHPEERCESPTELLQAVEAVEMAISTGSRHGRLPLAWEGDVADWRPATTSAGVTRMAAPTLAARAQAQTSRLRDATRHLQEAADLEQHEREVERWERSRRNWLVVGAAVAALAFGFAIGRSRPRRSELFRLRP